MSTLPTRAPRRPNPVHTGQEATHPWSPGIKLATWVALLAMAVGALAVLTTSSAEAAESPVDRSSAAATPTTGEAAPEAPPTTATAEPAPPAPTAPSATTPAVATPVNPITPPVPPTTPGPDSAAGDGATMPGADPPAYAATVLSDGAVAYYRMNEAVGSLQAIDSAPAARPATVLDHAAFGGTGAFAGSTDPSLHISTYTTNGSISRGAAIGLPAANTSRSIEGWIKTGGDQAHLHTIAAWGGFSAGVRGRSIVVSQPGAPEVTFDATNLIADGAWHHIAVTYAAPNATAYLDGGSLGTKALASPLATAASAQLDLAVEGWTSSSWYDDIAIYPTALTAAKVMNHFTLSGNTRPATPAVTAVAGDGAATSTWTVPTASVPAGQGAVNGYFVVAVKAGVGVQTVIAPATSTGVTMTGLAAGSYQFLVIPFNGFGSGGWGLSAAVTVTGATTTYPSRVIADGAAAYYRFSEPVGAPWAGDSAPPFRNATLPVNATFGDPGALSGSADASLHISTYTSEGSVTRLAASGLPSADGARTVEGWLRTNGDQAKLHTIASWGGYGVGVKGRSVVVSAAGQPDLVFDTPGLLIDGKWHQIAVTYTAGSATAYVDGVSLGTKVLSGGPLSTATSSALVLGADGWTSEVWYDEIAIYPTALTAAQIASHFTLSGNSRPAAPATVTVTPSAPGAVAVSWAASTATVPAGQNAIDGYQVVALRTGGGGQAAQFTAATVTTAAFTGLTAGTYQFIVIPLNGFGSGGWGVSASTPVTGAAATYPAQVVIDGAAAYYRFSDGAGAIAAADSAGFRQATISQNTSFGAAGALGGSPEAALHVSTYTSNGGLSRLEATGLPSADGARTVEGWLKTTSDQAKPHTMASWGDFRVVVRGRSVVVTSTGQPELVFDAVGLITDGKWHHVAVTYAAGSVTAYLDGGAMGTKALPGGTLATPASVRLDLAQEGTTTDSWYDEIAIYPTALTAAQITNHFTLSGDTRPTAPTVTASASSAGTVSLSWTAATATVPAGQSAVDGYEIFALRSGGGGPGVTTTGGTVTSVNLTGLTAGSYVFLVVPFNGFGFGGWALSPATSVTGATATYPSQVVADGATAYYRFSEGVGAPQAADTAANRYATLLRHVGFGEAGALGGSPEGSMHVSTYTDSGALSRLPAVGLPAADSARTVEGWLKTGGSQTAGHTIAAWGGFSVGVKGRSVIVAQSGQADLSFDAVGLVTDAKWHQVTATYAAGSVTVYLDGLALGTKPLPGGVIATPSNVQLDLGGEGWTADAWYDEIAIYPTALSAAQVANHFGLSGNTRPAAPGTVTATSPVASSAQVTWSAATATVPSGQSAVDNYVISAVTGGTTVATSTVTSSQLSVGFTGLGAGSYTFKVTGINGFGSGVGRSSAPVAVTGPATYAQGVLGDGASAYYRFSEGAGASQASDSSPGARPATVLSHVGFGDPGSLGGSPEAALHISTYTTAGSLSRLPAVGLPAADGARTVEGWLKTAGPETATHTIAAWGGFAVGLRGRNIVVSSSGQADLLFDAPSLINDGKWHAVTVTYASGSVVAYLDGAALGTQNLPGATLATPASTQLDMAKEGWVADAWYDEIAIYPTALTAAKVAAHFTLSGDTRPLAPGSVAATVPTASSAKVTWTPSTATVPAGQNAIDSYSITATRAGVIVASTTVPGSVLTATLTGLPAGTYTFSVVGANGFGRGVAGTSAALAVTGPASTYSSTVLGDAPAAYYRFAEATGSTQASDSAATSHPAPLLDHAAFGEAGALVTSPDNALKISTYTTGGSVSRVAATGLPSANSARTVEGWLKTGGAQTSVHTIAAWGGYAVSVKGRSVVVTVSGQADVVFDAPGILNDSTWHHITVTYVANSLTAYVDGLPLGSKPTSGALSTPASAPLALAVEGWTSTTWYDEIAVYPTALTAAKVLAHFTASGAQRPSVPSSVTVVTAGASAADVTWPSSTANVPTGQRAVDGYVVTATRGTTVVASQTVPGTATTARFTGLAGVAHTFTVVAINGFGPSGPRTSAAFTVTGPATTYASSVRSDGAVGYYRFSEATGATQASDSSTGSRPATLLSNVSFGETGALRTEPDHATRISTWTSGGSVSAVAGAGLPSADGARSVEGWIRTGGSLTASHTLAAWGGFAVSVRGRAVVVSAAGQPDLVFDGPGAISDNAWHHVVVTHGAGAFSAYVDGLLLGTRTAPALNTAANAALDLAVEGWSSTAWYDELAIYPGALTSAQIKAHYLAAGYPSVAASEAVANYTLGTDAAGSIPASGVLRYSFTGVAGRSLHLDQFAAAAGSTITVRDPNGRTIISVPVGASIPARLPLGITGSYSITVTGSGGAVTYRLSDAGAAASPGAPVISTTQLPMQPVTVIGANTPQAGVGFVRDDHEVDVFRFDGLDGEVIDLGSPGSCDRDVRWNLRDPAGRVLIERDMRLCAFDGLKLTTSGEYTLTVATVGTNSEYRFELWRNPLLSSASTQPPVFGPASLSRVAAPTVASGGTALVELYGKNVPVGSTVAFTKAGSSIPVKHQHLGAGATTLEQSLGSAVLDLRTATAGVYDTVVTLPDASTVRLNSSLTVDTTPRPAPHVDVQVQGPTTLRIGAVSRQWVIVSNPEPRDLYGVYTDVVVEPTLNCRLVSDVERYRAELVASLTAAGAPAATIAYVQAMDLTMINAPTRGADGKDHLPVHIAYLPAGRSYTVVLECQPTATSGAGTGVVVKVGDLSNAYHVTGPMPGQLAMDADPYLNHIISELSHQMAQQDPSGPTEEEIHGTIRDSLSGIIGGGDGGGMASGAAAAHDPSATNWALAGVGLTATGIALYFGFVATASLASAAIAAVATAVVVALVAYAVWQLVSAVAKWLDGVLGRDPNDVVGPTGVGPERWVPIAGTRTYTLRFENSPDATAPAQHVRVTTKLDPDLDWSSFRFTSANVGGVNVPLTGTLDNVSGSATIPAFGGTLVTVTGHIDRATGSIDWTFAGPPNLDDPFAPTPYGDFLPPDVASPEGEGQVQYTVSARAGLPHGQQITAAAEILFDEHDSGGSMTPTPVWTNTIDATAPSATVAALPAQSGTSIPVSWAATDIGSGVKNVSVYVSVDGGAFTVWKANVTTTSATYTGAAHHTYGFCSVARDNVDLVEQACSTPEAATTVP